LLRYQGLAVVYYGYALECLANGRLALVKYPGYILHFPDATGEDKNLKKRRQNDKTDFYRSEYFLRPLHNDH